MLKNESKALPHRNDMKSTSHLYPKYSCKTALLKNNSMQSWG